MPSWITEQVVTAGAAINADNWHELTDKLKVTAVVNLRAEYQDTFAEPLPAAYLWLPVQDHTEPTSEQLLVGVRFVDAAVRANRRVLIHCKLGIGRSPTLAAAYLIWSGMTADEAVQKVESSLTLVSPGPILSQYTLRQFAELVSQQR